MSTFMKSDKTDPRAQLIKFLDKLLEIGRKASDANSSLEMAETRAAVSQGGQRLRIPAEEYPSLPWGPKYLPRLPWNSAQDDANYVDYGNWQLVPCILVQPNIQHVQHVQHVCKKNIESRSLLQKNRALPISRRGHSLLSNGPGLLMVVNLTYLMDGSDDLRS